MNVRTMVLGLILTIICTSAFAVGDHERPKNRKEHDAYVEQLKSDHPTIALLPVQMRYAQDSDAAAAQFTELLTIKLERLGYTVIGPEAYQEAWQAELQAIGGIYDPITGRLDSEKHAGASARVRALISETTGATAFLESGVVSREITHKSRVARFGGVKSVPYAKGGATVFGTTLNMGVIRAALLKVRLLTTDNEVLFENFGGIHLLTRETKTGYEPAFPAEQVLRIDDFNREAVHLALRGMLYDTRTLGTDIKARQRENARKPQR